MTQNGSPVAGAEPLFVAGAIALRLEFSSCLSHLQHAVMAIRAWCELSEGHRAAAWKIELAVMEALSNIVVHAYRERAGQPITVLWIDRPDRLVIEISDRGEPMCALPDTDFPSATQEGGRGWPILRACLDRVSYRSENGINVLTLEKHAVTES